MTAGARRLISASAPYKGSGSNSNSDPISVTMPSTASCGASSRISTVTTSNATPSIGSQTRVAPPALSFSVIAASGSRERMSRSGLSTATVAASIPPPIATA